MPTAASFWIVNGTGTSSDCVVKAEGEVDVAYAAAFTDTLLQALATGPVRVVVDMADVSFIDSSGLSALVTAFKHGAANGIAVALRSPSANLVRLLDLTGLADMLEVVPSGPVASEELESG